MKHRFALVHIVGTPGAPDALQEACENPATFLFRYVTGDWGEVDEHDRLENEFSVANGLRILSAYTLTTGTRLWIITEADRSSTTILLPSEY
jgi:hypothetical protein